MFAIVWLSLETADAETMSLEPILRIIRTVLMYSASSVSPNSSPSTTIGYNINNFKLGWEFGKGFARRAYCWV